jgi:hypothetical protein
MLVGAGRLIGGKTAGGYTPPVEETPLRSAGMWNQIFSSMPTSSTRDCQSNVITHIIGTNTKDIAVRLPARGYTDTARLTPGNDLNFLGVCGTINGVSKMFTFEGLQTVTVPDGSAGEISDFLLPSDFGFAGGYFPRGTSAEFRYIINVVNGGKIPSVSSNTPYSDYSGQCRWYDDSVTTPSAILGTGNFTFTGTAATTVNQGYKLQIVGHPVVDEAIPALVGASLGVGQNDSARGAYGRGYLQGMLHDGSFGNVYAAMNLCREAATVTTFNTLTDWRDELAFCNCAVVDVCGNDLQQSASAATIYSRLQTLWGIIRASGISRIMQVGIGSATSSTDSWRTYANQTLLAIVPAGITLTSTLQTAYDNGEIQAWADFNTLRDPGGTFKWLADGTTPNLIVGADGVHYSTSGYNRAAIELRPWRDQLFNCPWMTVSPVVSGTAPYEVGSVLSVNGYGTWKGSPAPTLSGEWFEGGVATGDTDSAFTIDTGNTNHVYKVTADNGVGPAVVAYSNTVTSAPSDAFSPDDLTAPLELYYFVKDFATLTLSASDVTALADKSSNARNGTSTAGARGTYDATGLNGYPCIIYTASHTMTFNDLPVNNGVTVYWVGQITGTGNRGQFSGNINGAFQLRVNSNNAAQLVSRGVAARLSSANSAISTNTPMIMMAELQPGGTKGRIVLNGVTIASNISGSAFTAITGAMNQLFHATGEGRVGGMSVHRGVLPVADHNQLLEFWGTEFGISYTTMS